MRISLPPIEKKVLFYEALHFRIFTTIASQNEMCYDQGKRPKWEEGKDPTSHPTKILLSIILEKAFQSIVSLYLSRLLKLIVQPPFLLSPSKFTDSLLHGKNIKSLRVFPQRLYCRRAPTTSSSGRNMVAKGIYMPYNAKPRTSELNISKWREDSQR